MASSITKFVSLLKTSGLANTSHFSVFFTPVTRSNKSNSTIENVLMYCHEVNLPGINISSNPAKIFGETFEFPYEKIYGNLVMSFYVDTNMEVKRVFDDWQAQIQDPITRRYGYYADYTTDLIVSVYDMKSRKVYSMKFYEAYPKTTGDIQLSYSASGQSYMLLSVTFTYKYFETNVDFGVSGSDLLTGIDSPGVGGYFDNFKQFQKDAFSAVNGTINTLDTARKALSSTIDKALRINF